MKIIGDKGLPAAKAEASATINAAAQARHHAHETPPFILMMKAEEAQRFLATYPDQALAPPSVLGHQWPFIAAETGLTAATAWLVAKSFTTQMERYARRAAQIEVARLRAIAAAHAAGTPDALQAAQAINWPD